MTLPTRILASRQMDGKWACPTCTDPKARYHAFFGMQPPVPACEYCGREFPLPVPGFVTHDDSWYTDMQPRPQVAKVPPYDESIPLSVYGLLFVVFGLPILSYAYLAFVQPAQGAGRCETLARRDNPAAFEQATEIGRMWSRRQQTSQVSAIVLQPNDVSQKPFTAVCHFSTSANDTGTVEYVDGDVRERLASISRSYANPLSWRK